MPNEKLTIKAITRLGPTAHEKACLTQAIAYLDVGYSEANEIIPPRPDTQAGDQVSLRGTFHELLLESTKIKLRDCLYDDNAAKSLPPQTAASSSRGR
jgi:hypothetical protein